MMYCLKYFLVLLLMPTTGASPHFLAVFLLSLFVRHRPCPYCSILLFALFSTTCYFNDYCFFDLNNGNLFLPRLFLPKELGSKPLVVYDALADRAIFTMAWIKRSMVDNVNPASLQPAASAIANSTISAAANSFREFKLPCVQIKVRL
ncbi:hypothetical protein V1514DRAFT_337403 [Lipomyces japonicus]|uniref:uncharacterized protein n=1 Tax=Lipomyces japonicus TaxID=56871 RepID=UPI0034CFDC99